MHIETKLSEKEIAELYEWFEDIMRPITEALKEAVMWLAETLGKLAMEVQCSG